MNIFEALRDGNNKAVLIREDGICSDVYAMYDNDRGRFYWCCHDGGRLDVLNRDLCKNTWKPYNPNEIITSRTYPVIAIEKSETTNTCKLTVIGSCDIKLPATATVTYKSLA